MKSAWPITVAIQIAYARFVKWQYESRGRVATTTYLNWRRSHETSWDSCLYVLLGLRLFWWVKFCGVPLDSWERFAQAKCSTFLLGSTPMSSQTCWGKALTG